MNPVVIILMRKLVLNYMRSSGTHPSHKMQPHRVIFKSRRMGWVGHSACVGEMRNVYRKWRPLQRSRHKWEDNIKMYLIDC
jgi:predicted DNA-binding transcriptional regulator YafY